MNDNKPKDVDKKTVAKIIKDLGGDERFTKRRIVRRSKYPRVEQNSYSQNISRNENDALMIDIAEYPTASFGYKYLLVCTDLATRDFDIEKMKNKDSQTVLNAMMKMFERKYIDLPKYYMISDNGSEFKSVFHRYLYDKNVFHKQIPPGRHQQLAPVDSLINQLNRIFNAYMTSKEVESKKQFRNWTDIIDTVREELNKFRRIEPEELAKLPPPLVQTTEKIKVPKIIKTKDEKGNITKSTVLIDKEVFKKPKFKVNQNVYRLLELPKDALGKTQSGAFRTGDYRIDPEPHRISEIVYINGPGPTFRYILEGIPFVSYEEGQLKTRL
jgi:hypothetical protein